LVYATISNRSLNATSITSVRTAANIDLSPPPTTKRAPRGFQPAKAIVFVAGVQSDVKETSQITGLKYNPRDGQTYTVPMGQKTGEIYEGAVQQSIITAVADLTDASVTFRPEVWKN
jgi:hypothetical protein